MPLPPFQLERFFARWEFAADHILCASDIEGVRQRELLEVLDDETRTLWQQLTLGYTESAGHPLLREAIAELYDTLSAGSVLTFAGAQEAILALGSVLVGPGDHVVAMAPVYQSLYEVPRSVGADLSFVRLEHDRDWQLSPEMLDSAVSPRTRLVILNFPHSPTGSHPDVETFHRLIDVARRTHAYVISDEVYRFLAHDPADELPPAADLYDRAISIGVMSKAFGLAGLRIGWIATPDQDVLDRAAGFKDYTTICSSAPSEILAIGALRAREHLLARAHRIIATNLELLDEFFAAWPDVFEWVRPHAGTTAFPRLHYSVPIRRFVEELIRETGVLLLPGELFDHPGNHFRIGFGRTDLPEALDKLDGFARLWLTSTEGRR